MMNELRVQEKPASSSARVPQSVIDTLLERTDLGKLISGTVRLRSLSDGIQRGGCPFHTGSDNTLIVDQAEQRFHCSEERCGFAGSAIGWLMYHDGLTFRQAVSDLAAASEVDVSAWINADGLQVHERERQQVLRLVAEHYHAQLLCSDEQMAYLQSRGIETSSVETFMLGFADDDQDGSRIIEAMHGRARALWTAGVVTRRSDKSYYPRFRDRIMFPIRDAAGVVRGYGGRTVTDSHIKYLNSAASRSFDKGQLLYGLHEALAAGLRSKNMIVVEGYLDVVALAQAGFGNVVGTMGTALTEAQLASAFEHYKEVILCFDGDDAGRQASLKSILTACRVTKEGQSVSYVELDEGLDPCEYLQTRSAGEFHQLLDRRVPLEELLVAMLSMDLDLDSVGGLARLAHLAKPYLEVTRSDALRRRLTRTLEGVIGVEIDSRSNH